MLVMNPVEHALRVLDKFRGWTFPVQDRSAVPLKPWHPDGDVKFTVAPTKKVDESDKIIEHMKNSGHLNISTGDVVPTYDGRTDGVYMNVATSKDPLFEISHSPGAGKLWVSTGYSAPYGKKVRIGKKFVAQGYPMNEYSDHKMHIFDPIDKTVTEIQFVTEMERNPFLSVLALLMGLLTGKNLHGGYHCHGVRQYSLTVPSTHESVKGSSAANMPLAATAPRYDDIMRGYLELSTMGVPAAARHPNFLAPAENSDGKSGDPNAVKMGMVLRLKPEAFDRLAAGAGPQATNVLRCWRDVGIMVVDSADHVTFGVDPDPRWDQKDLSRITTASLDDFEVFVYD